MQARAGEPVEYGLTLGDHHQPMNELIGKSIQLEFCLLYTSPSPRDVEESRMPSSA